MARSLERLKSCERKLMAGVLSRFFFRDRNNSREAEIKTALKRRHGCDKHCFVVFCWKKWWIAFIAFILER